MDHPGFTALPLRLARIARRRRNTRSLHDILVDRQGFCKTEHHRPTRLGARSGGAARHFGIAGPRQQRRLFGGHGQDHLIEVPQIGFADPDAPAALTGRKRGHLGSPGNFDTVSQAFDQRCHFRRADPRIFPGNRPGGDHSLVSEFRRDAAKKRMADGEILRAVIEGKIVTVLFDSARRNAPAGTPALVENMHGQACLAQHSCAGDPAYSGSDDGNLRSDRIGCLHILRPLAVTEEFCPSHPS